MTMKVMAITKTRFLNFLLPVLMLTSAFATTADNTALIVTGRWQLSWEARMGTERGALQLEQTDSGLAGSFQGGVFGSPKVSGKVEGKNVILNLEFHRAHSFTLVFTGTVDGDKMTGKFEIQGMNDGYDWHGENARPTNYSWTAVREPDQPSIESIQNPAGKRASSSNQ
jgi:hypothetical protein